MVGWKTYCLGPGLTIPKQTKHLPVPFLDHLFGFTGAPAHKTQKSMWAAVIGYAGKKNVLPGNFEAFVRDSGGIARVWKLSRRLS